MARKKQKMDLLERVLLLEMLMCDIESWWDVSPKKRIKDARVWKCLELIDEFVLVSYNLKHKENKMFAAINWFEYYQTIGVYLAGRHEGSLLENGLSCGGYTALALVYNGLEPKFSLRSKEFCDEIKKYVRTDFTYKHE